MRLSLSPALLLALLSIPGTDVRAAAPTLEILPDTIRADENGTWRAGLKVQNNGEWGLYADSLNLVWKRTDDEVSAMPREGVNSLTGIVRVIPPASAGESTGMEWIAPADFERGTLTFQLYMHDAKKTPYMMENSAVVTGNDLYDRYPRVAIDVAGGRKVEVVHLPALGE